MTSKDIYASLTKYVDRSNKYYRTYVDLCSKAATRGSKKQAKSVFGYVEGHHIVPRSYNEELQSETNNIVYMTAREHFIAHKLLIRISSGVYVHKAKLAITMFMQNSNSKLQRRVLSSRDFEYIRKMASEVITGKPPPNLGKSCYTNGDINIFIGKDEEPPEGFYKGSKNKSYVTYTNGIENCTLPLNEEPPEGFYRGTKTKFYVTYTNGIENRKLPPNEKPPEGFYRGSILKSYVIYTNGIQDRRLPPNEKPPEGFREGSCTKGKPGPHTDEARLKIGKSNSGKICITNGVKDKKINPNEDIPDGWYRGRTFGYTYHQKPINDFLEYNGFKSLDEFKGVLTECVSSGMTFSQLNERFPKTKQHPVIGTFLKMFNLTDKVKRTRVHMSDHP